MTAMRSALVATVVLMTTSTSALADTLLVPDEYPTIRRIYDSCLQLPAFAQAAPEKQPDANT